MTTLFQRNLAEHTALFAQLSALSDVVDKAGLLLSNALKAGSKIMFCGNGGSAADSQHLASELTGRFIKDRRPLAGIALSTDSSALTCIGNDYGFDEVFSRQVLGLGRRGDCLVAISTSGNSRNVLLAVEAAHSIGMHTLGLLGRDGGTLRSACGMSIVVPSSSTARIQETHIFVGHTLCGIIEESLGLA